VLIKFRSLFFSVKIATSFMLAACVFNQSVFAGDDLVFGDLKARNIGPAAVSGRVMAITGVPGKPGHLFVGAATSGVWKTEDAGITWAPITDEIDTSSIGAVAVNPKDPNIIWLGTGEPKPRYGTGIGTGVYKSVDGGKTWQKKGLLKTERIQDIVLDPNNSDIAYAGAIGPAWSDGKERGVFKTTDGGDSWQKILFTNASSGAAALVMDPGNSDKLFAAMWDFRREPWFFRSGGPGSGIFVTEDGGKNWKKLDEAQGLPSGNLGRIGLAIAPSDPNRVYALIEAEESGLYRSDDGGENWIFVSNSKRQFTILSRPWYFQVLVADPVNPDKVYHVHDQVEVSTDAGVSFTNITGGKSVHPDHHALWINPENPDTIWTGNDGGVYYTHSGGKAWRYVDNLPMAQLYNVTVDNETPYNIYTTIQDQANWRAPSSVWNHDGLVHQNWKSFPGGESSFVLPIEGDTRFVYSLGNMGPIYLTDTVTGVTDNISPVGISPDVAIRRNNAAAVALDPFNRDAVYYGSQYVHKSDDRGKSWKIISPDLTTNNPDKQNYWNSGGLTWENFGGVTHTTIIVIAPSPLDSNVIWVGTDDGNIQVTKDGGKSWKNVTKKLLKRGKNTPKEGFWVSSIEPSHFSATEAFVSVNDYRRGDKAAYLYHTKNMGKSWQSLSTDNVRGPGHFIEQDSEVPKLLFWGTEYGLYISLDAGVNWKHFKGGLPMVAVRGTAVQGRDADLAIATFGRGAYILDDIRPLRALAEKPELEKEALHVFDIPPVQQHRRTYTALYPAQLYRGENKAYGLTATFQASTNNRSNTASIMIIDDKGKTVRQFEDVLVHDGLNRFVWDLQTKPSAFVPSYYEGWGPTSYSAGEINPGAYTMTVQYAGEEVTQPFEVLADPRSEVTAEDLELKSAAVSWLQAVVGEMMAGYDAAGLYVASIDAFITTSQDAAAIAQAQALRADMIKIQKRIHFTFGQQEVMTESYAETMRREWPGGVLDYVTRLVWPVVSNLAAAPTLNQRLAIKNAEARMTVVANDFNALVEGRVVPFTSTFMSERVNELVPKKIVFTSFE